MATRLPSKKKGPAPDEGLVPTFLDTSALVKPAADVGKEQAAQERRRNEEIMRVADEAARRAVEQSED